MIALIILTIWFEHGSPPQTSNHKDNNINVSNGQYIIACRQNITKGRLNNKIIVLDDVSHDRIDHIDYYVWT